MFEVELEIRYPIPTGVYLIQFFVFLARMYPYCPLCLLYAPLYDPPLVLKVSIDIDLLSTPQTGEEDPLSVSLLVRLDFSERMRVGRR